MVYVLILGADTEIGQAISKKYARYGYGLYLAGKDSEGISEFARKVEKKYRQKAKFLKFDPLEFYNHKEFYNELNPKPLGVICALNYLGDQHDAQNNFLEAKKIIDMNFTGCVSILNIIANDFEARREGFIVGITSVEGERGRRNSYIYGSTKAAFTAYLSGLRSRLHISDVNVSTIKTGIIRTKELEGENLPVFLTAKPGEIAHDVFKTQQKNRDIAYSKWTWRYAARYFNAIPEKIFKKLDT